MRYTFLLVAFVLASYCYGQAGQKASLRFKQEPLSNVLSELTNAYKIQFAYSSDRIDLQKRITVKFRDANLSLALERIFRNTGIRYSVTGSLVTLETEEKNTVTISGMITESGTGELLIGAIVSTIPANAGCVSNAYGFYSLTLPKGTWTFEVKYFGYKTAQFTLDLSSSKTHHIALESERSLNEVVIQATSDKNLQTNHVDVHLKEIEAIPAMLGEKDVVKYISLMPGVQKGNEGNSYLHVRGGAADQNLVLIDDAVIYNAYHYLGLSSLFTGSELRNATLIKGGFSSKYGGRISSVLDMSTKDGSKEKTGIEASTGFISSKVMVEGPIAKDKASFLVSVRRCYMNEVSKVTATTRDNELNYRYTDVHAKLSTEVFKKSRFFLSGYLGQDQLITATDPELMKKEEGLKWGNKAAIARWNQVYGPKVFSNTSLIYSSYVNRTGFGESGKGYVSLSFTESSINDYSIKHDMDIMPGARHLIRAGGSMVYRVLSSVAGTDAVSNGVNSDNAATYNTYIYESNLYAEDEYKPVQWLVITPGIRFTRFSSSKAFQTIEPRFTCRLFLRNNVEIGAGYSQMNQFMHMISPMGGMGIPIEQWTASGITIKPQHGQIYTLGICKNDIMNSGISILIEGYYKTIDNVSGLKEGTSLLQVIPFKGNVADPNWQSLVTQGTCTSYGGELMIRQTKERFTWWVSYTLSKTTLQFSEMNMGNSFPAMYDRTHDVGAFVNLRLSKHFSFSSNWVYGTGNAISLPVGEYYPVIPDPTGTGSGTGAVYDYESKNAFRMRAYTKLDLSLQYKHRLGKGTGTLELSVYNALNRANPFYYQITNENTNDGNSKRVLKQVSLFPIIPSLSWSFKF